MSPPRSETWNFLSMGTSVVSTISISLTLKEVFILNPDTPVVALVIFHLLCAFLLTSSLWVVGYYKLPQEIPWGYVSLLGVVQAFAITTANENLEHNSIGFYQISKMGAIPTIIILELVLGWREFPSGEVISSLAVTLAGVGMVSVQDVTVNLVGFGWAILAVFSVSTVQLLAGRQKQYQMTPLQLLHISIPFSLVTLSIFSYYQDDIPAFLSHGVTTKSKALILFSGFLSVLINVCAVVIIGSASPVTYQVIGHFKTISLIVLGFLIFRNPITFWQLVGICLSLVGTFYYSRLKLQKKPVEKVVETKEIEEK